MANSKYEYVKEFEREDVLLRNTWVVVRIDGRGFHKYVFSSFPPSVLNLCSPSRFPFLLQCVQRASTNPS